MLKPKIEIDTSRKNDTHAKINIPKGCPFTCIKILTGIMKELEMEKPHSEERLKSHRYEDWQGQSETYTGKHSTASVIYNENSIHLIATDKTKEGQDKLIQSLREHFIPTA